MPASFASVILPALKAGFARYQFVRSCGSGVWNSMSKVSGLIVHVSAVDSFQNRPGDSTRPALWRIPARL